MVVLIKFNKPNNKEKLLTYRDLQNLLLEHPIVLPINKSKEKKKGKKIDGIKK
jgi:hypothetical protein